jgi:hypothetical protein
VQAAEISTAVRDAEPSLTADSVHAERTEQKRAHLTTALKATHIAQQVADHSAGLTQQTIARHVANQSISPQHPPAMSVRMQKSHVPRATTARQSDTKQWRPTRGAGNSSHLVDPSKSQNMQAQPPHRSHETQELGAVADKLSVYMNQLPKGLQPRGHSRFEPRINAKSAQRSRPLQAAGVLLDGEHCLVRPKHGECTNVAAGLLASLAMGQETGVDTDEES